MAYFLFQPFNSAYCNSLPRFGVYSQTSHQIDTWLAMLMLCHKQTTERETGNFEHVSARLEYFITKCN